MNPNDLPFLLRPIQAIILLATGNAALAARAVPNATGTTARGHRDAIPVEGLNALSRRMKAERRGVLRQTLEYTGSRPRRPQHEPLSVDQRAQLAGELSDWNGGFSLSNLAILTGSSLEPYVKQLVDVARSGKAATFDRDGNPIALAVWNGHSMREALKRPGVLILVPDPYHQIDEDTAVEPLFRRDDVLPLMAMGTSPATLPPVRSTPKATDEAVAEFIKVTRAALSDAKKNHGRDLLLAEAARHFGVSRKYVLDVWNRKRLGKKSLHAKT
jgi:hypothetical protein